MTRPWFWALYTDPAIRSRWESQRYHPGAETLETGYWSGWDRIEQLHDHAWYLRCTRFPELKAFILFSDTDPNQGEPTWPSQDSPLP